MNKPLDASLVYKRRDTKTPAPSVVSGISADDKAAAQDIASRLMSLIADRHSA